jgi:DNA-directed RNA polymerase subunit alpha
MTLPRIERAKLQGNSAEYTIGPLEPGFGDTIGSSFTRVLSALGGAAVTAIRLQTVYGVMEGIDDIILNIKRIRLRSSEVQPVTLVLQVEGKKIVTAADIQAPSSIEFVNPDCPILTLLPEHARLVMEFTVQVGRGYIPAYSQANQQPGEIGIDAIYCPVCKAVYSIERIRVGDMVNFERILLTVETDGRITPDEALNQGGTVLTHLFERFALPHDVLEQRKASQSSMLIPADIYDMPLDELGLSVRSFNTLNRASIKRVGQVLEMGEEELRGIRNLGVKGQVDLSSRLQEAGCFPPPSSPGM